MKSTLRTRVIDDGRQQRHDEVALVYSCGEEKLRIARIDLYYIRTRVESIWHVAVMS